MADNYVSTTLEGIPSLQSTEDDGRWLSRPIPDSISEAMEAAPMGWLYDITYAVLKRRLQKLLSPESPVAALLSSNLVNTAINFRALNPNYAPSPRTNPAVPPNSGAAEGRYHSSVWAPTPREVMPHTLPMATEEPAYAVGQDPTGSQNKGLLIAKLFWDLQHHLPCVLFNVVAKNYVPVGLGGSSVSRRFYHDGKVITELAYKTQLSVEAMVVGSDEPATTAIQAIVEAAFGTLRDHVDFGATVTGRSWQLTLPVRLSPSNITETDAPWAQGDDKGSKLYTASIGLEDLTFEAIAYIGKPLVLMTSGDPSGAQDDGVAPGIRLGGESADSATSEEPMRLKLGVPQRLVVTGASMRSDLAVSQKKKVVEIRRPYAGSGLYEIIPRRTGEATVLLFDTGMTMSAQTSELSAGRGGAPLVQRRVVVTAV